uniref:Uncharacterized protein n=1 Tax=Panagrolaimus sp. ES5 TaxID=591445 RepID=A0AC34F3A3_9BILA
MDKVHDPKHPNRYQWGSDDQITSNESTRENSVKTTDSVTSFSSKETQRRQQTDRKLKKYGRQMEVKLCKSAIEELHQETMKQKHEEKCRRESEALKRKENSLAKKKKAAQETQQISNQIKNLKDSFSKKKGQWPNTFYHTDL